LATGSVTIEDVTFGPDGLQLRLYRPAGSGPFPAVVDIHGGAWTSGDRTMNAPIDQHLAEQGVLVAALDFRAAPAHRFPAAVEDVDLGIRWLKDNATRLGSRPELVGGLGTSSGGHLLLLAALRPGRYAAHALPDSASDSSLPFLVACWPVANPLARFRMATDKKVENLLAAHAAFWPDEAAMADGNPQLILERGEAGSLAHLLVLQGEADGNLTPDMARRLVAAWHEAHGQATLETFPEQPHSFIARDPAAPSAIRALALITDFVLQQAKARA
jgi:acetyl esterase